MWLNELTAHKVAFTQSILSRDITHCWKGNVKSKPELKSSQALHPVGKSLWRKFSFVTLFTRDCPKYTAIKETLKPFSSCLRTNQRLILISIHVNGLRLLFCCCERQILCLSVSGESGAVSVYNANHICTALPPVSEGDEPQSSLTVSVL